MSVLEEMSKKGVDVLADTNVMLLARGRFSSKFYIDNLGFSSFSSIFLFQEKNEELIHRMNKRSNRHNWTMEKFLDASVNKYNKDSVKKFFNICKEDSDLSKGNVLMLSANIEVDYLVELFKENNNVIVLKYLIDQYLSR